MSIKIGNMFSNFHTFTEVVKLSQSNFYQLRKINYSDRVLNFIFDKRDIDSLEQVFDLVENVRSISKFACLLENYGAYDRNRDKRLIKCIYNISVSKGNINDEEAEDILFRWSCSYGLLDEVKYFKGYSKNSGLIEAMAEDYIEIVKYLLDNYEYDSEDLEGFKFVGIDNNSAKYFNNFFQINYEN